MDGMDLLKKVHSKDPDMAVVMSVPLPAAESAKAALRGGAFDCVTKPFDNDELNAVVTRAVEMSDLQRENRKLREQLDVASIAAGFIAEAPKSRQLVAMIRRVAPSRTTALIEGETGTGKELVAHEIHRRSRRAERPMIRVNCASIPHELYESEFFGHAKGAFTGAIRDRAGRFEAAEGGTLFLDEIGEVPLDVQGKLLRALQEKSYERVGEERTRHADVRIVAATNRDLRKEAAAGRFREDLYYRLNVFPIHIAPLRERSDDIALLAQHFIELSARDMRCPRPRLTRAALTQLLAYGWPGNIRELRNVIERGVIIARGGNLEVDLPTPAGAAPAAARRSAAGAGEEGEGEGGRGFLSESEMDLRVRDNLLAVLERADWRIKGPAGAAALLGVKATTLVSRIRKLGLKRPR